MRKIKYRKKPVVIEAFKWTGDINQKENPVWIIEAIKNKTVWFNKNGDLEIATLEGNHIARKGEYIIKGVAGEIYPCKSDIFKQTYETV